MIPGIPGIPEIPEISEIPEIPEIYCEKAFNNFAYRKTSINVRGNYYFFTFFLAGIIRGRTLLEV